MKKKNMIRSALSLLLAAVLCLSMAACSSQQAPAEQPQETDTQETAPPEQETEKQESDGPPLGAA